MVEACTLDYVGKTRLAGLPLNRSEFHTRCRVPDAHCIVLACRDNSCSVRAEGHTGNSRPMATERSLFLSRLDVPDFDGAVQSSRDNAIAIWAEVYTCDTIPVSSEHKEFFASDSVPNSNCVVVLISINARIIPASRGNSQSIGTEADAANVLRVTAEGKEFVATCQVPHSDSAVFASRHQASSV